jgi:cell division septal protein FtsQ
VPDRSRGGSCLREVAASPLGDGAAGWVSRALPSARSLLAGLGVLALALAAYTAARESSVFAIEKIEVTGASPALNERVRSALAPLEGTSLVEFRRSELERRVAGLPDVVTASADRSFPNTLVVTVRAEHVLAVLRRGAESWLLSARGRILRPLARGARPRLPRIWVTRSVDLSSGAVVTDPAALRALRALRAVAASRTQLHVRSVGIERGRTTLILRSGTELRLGGSSDLPLKLAVAERVLPRLGPATLPGTRYLDLSVPSRPVAGTASQAQAEVESSGASVR